MFTLYTPGKENPNVGFCDVDVIRLDVPFSTLQYHDVGDPVDASVHVDPKFIAPLVGVHENAATGVVLPTPDPKYFVYLVKPGVSFSFVTNTSSTEMFPFGAVAGPQSFLYASNENP
jgi:hypothetical protein